MLLAAPRPPIEIEMRSFSLRLKSTGLPGRCGEALEDDDAEPPAAFAFARLRRQRECSVKHAPCPLLQRDLEVESVAAFGEALRRQSAST